MSKWLLKSEPSAYSLEDLKAEGETIWDGVRNYQARNFFRDEFQEGDLAFFYHSNTKSPAIVGIVRVTRTGVADPTQFDPESEYFDEKATEENPRWITVRVAFEAEFKEPITREKLKEVPELSDMELLRKGSRLSVQPVSEEHWNIITGFGALSSPSKTP